MRISATYRRGLGGALWLVIFFALMSYARGWGAPLTDDQAKAFLQEWAKQYQADNPGTSYEDALLAVAAHKVVVLDTILDVTPTVTMPQMASVFTAQDLYLYWIPPYIDVKEGEYKDFHIQMPPVTEKGKVPRPSPWPSLAGILVGAAVAVAGEALLPIPPGGKELAAFGAGGAAGILTWALWPQ